MLAPVAADPAAWRLRCGRPGKSSPIFPHTSGSDWGKSQWDNFRRLVFQPVAAATGLATLERSTTTVAVDGKRRKHSTSRYVGPRPYDLRHTFASLLLAEGLAIHYVADELGHSAEMTLRTYGHVIAEYRDRQSIDAEAEIRAARNLMYPSRTLVRDLAASDSGAGSAHRP